MSTLAIDNFKPSAGGTSFGIEGVAKVSFSYDQQVPSVDSSYNISSITDNAQGSFTTDFNNNFSDAFYIVNSGANTRLGNDRGGYAVGHNTPTNSDDNRTTSDCDMACMALSTATSNAGASDHVSNAISIFGDLA